MAHDPTTCNECDKYDATIGCKDDKCLLWNPSMDFILQAFINIENNERRKHIHKK
jgi:hypothetical protein